MNFDGQVVLVTGSSRGLGSAFARCLGSAGARVVVNSTGANGYGDDVAAAIRAAGGEAVHIAGAVQEADALIERVITQCGRLDAVIHNAGVVQDKTLRKMSDAQWQDIIDIHLTASFRLTRAAWPHFESAGAGAMVLITSASGLYGNFGQANYAAAKAGMLGLSRTVAIEGARDNIRCNVVSPYGATEMNSQGMPEDRKAVIKPEYIAPLVAWLAHKNCTETGGLFETSAGVYTKLRWQRSRGLRLDTAAALEPAQIADGWRTIGDFSEPDYPSDMRDALGTLVARGMSTDVADDSAGE